MKLIAIQRVDWHTYIDFYKNHNLKTPTRELDKSLIDLDDPKAFKKIAPEHYHLTFIIYADMYDVIELMPLVIKKSLKDVGKGKFIVIASGYYEQWKTIVEKTCLEDLKIGIREVLRRL